MAALIRERRFRGQRPANLDAEQFSSLALKTAVQNLFARMEGKLDPVKAGFERSVAIWEQFGIFGEKREKAGYGKPDFERDYLPLLTPNILAMMEAGEGLDRGYDALVWSPVDLPVGHYFLILKEALIKAYNGTARGKAPQTLLIGPEKRVIGEKKVNINGILCGLDYYLKSGLVYNPQRLNPKEHGGMTEAQILKRLTGVEKATGGVMRLERTQLVMPRNVGKEEMSAQDWGALLGGQDNALPCETSFQDIKQDIAFVIYCLETQGWIPDFYDSKDVENSRVALALNTYAHDESPAGSVAGLYWYVDVGRVNLLGYHADNRKSFSGVRPGVRMG